MKEKLKQNKNEIGCPYHPKGTTKTFQKDEIYPYGICEWLYYSAYPYMLGILYGADFRYNEQGDAWVMCPAKNGCKTLVRKREHPGVFDDKRIKPFNNFVIYVEVVNVGECPANHKVGDKFPFPTCMKEHYMCPAVWYQSFPMQKIEVPECMNQGEIRCPDWKSDVTIDLGGSDNG